MVGPAVAHDASEYVPAAAEDYARITITQNYVLYATSTLLVYELLVTFDEEVERVWSLRWRLPKLLFMLNRYLARALLILQFIAGGYPGTSPSFCHIYGKWQIIPPRLAIFAAQAVMVIRLWAIYNNSKQILYLLLILYTTEVATVIVFMIRATLAIQGSSQPRPLGCGLDALTPLLRDYASATWIAPVCFEFLILVITLVKVVPPVPPVITEKAKFMKGFGVATQDRNPTLDMLARDSIIYFAFIFTFTLANAIIYERDFSAYYRAILLGPTSAISCIAVSRMIINIRSLPISNLSPTYASASNVIFVDDSDYDLGTRSGISQRPRSSVSRTHASGKERDVDDGSELVYVGGSNNVM